MPLARHPHEWAGDESAGHHVVRVPRRRIGRGRTARLRTVALPEVRFGRVSVAGIVWCGGHAASRTGRQAELTHHPAEPPLGVAEHADLRARAFDRIRLRLHDLGPAVRAMSVRSATISA
jgi:predicted short-subunit dehydrogenase-like oxidoreductase (DUF2520 family)